MATAYALKRLAQALGPGARLRPGQWEAIDAVVSHHKRALLVQRTGWGKSLVHFLATKILRERGAGPALPISPLLFLVRNKLIYALADYAIVVASDAGKGGTWAGATEALKARWIPVLVLDGPSVPEENRQLVKKGGIPFSIASLNAADSVRDWLATKADAFTPPPTQGRLL